VSGSLEEDGEKSPEKIRAFMNAVQDIRNEAAT
jgi:phosphoribosylanthranilate isomerase